MTVELWHRMLDDAAMRRDMPRVYRDNLIDAADDMFKGGIIDPLERFDMLELAEAAYSHEIEEQIYLYRYFRRSGEYSAVRDGKALGFLAGATFNWKERNRYLDRSFYDARVTPTDAGLELITRNDEVIGRIDGKRLITPTGEEYELIETMARIAGKEWPAITDPDQYRVMLDAIQLAAEEGEVGRHAALTARASVSIFIPCPSCNDSFSRREDCADCAGAGFVRETPDRFRWRS